MGNKRQAQPARITYSITMQPDRKRIVGDPLDVNRVAALLDMSVRWVKEQVKAGNQVGYRLGTTIKVEGDSLRQFLAARSMAPFPAERQ